MSARVGKSAICKAFWVFRGAFWGPLCGSVFLVSKSPPTGVARLIFGDVWIFIKKSHRVSSKIFKMSARVDRYLFLVALFISFIFTHYLYFSPLLFIFLLPFSFYFKSIIIYFSSFSIFTTTLLFFIIIFPEFPNLPSCI